MKFPGFDVAVDQRIWREVVQIPERFFSVDGQRFVKVDLNEMRVPADDYGDRTFRLLASLGALTEKTRLAGASILIDALDGQRKTGTVLRWAAELSLFSRTISELLDGQGISTITLGMYLWYQEKKNPSQVKLLRGVLLYWISTGAPGVQVELATHLHTTSPRSARGMVEVQNSEPSERPFSKQQIRVILGAVTQLYSSREFDPQSNFMWRLMISEAARPSQMGLMKFGDFRIDRHADGGVKAVHIMAAMVKQAGVPARSYMTEHRLSHAVGHAFLEHRAFVEELTGETPHGLWPVFGVQHATNPQLPSTYNRESTGIANLIQRSRKQVAELVDDLDSLDLFNRRFKHTKLTHLASAGASREVLAHAGFQTSTISLQRYVNLTEEAFAEYEEAMEDKHEEFATAFKGRVVTREQATHHDPEHLIAAPSLDDDAGSCGASPCGMLACYGCYVCDHYEAFVDGPHEAIEASLVADQKRARAAGLPEETIYRNAPILAGVRNVIRLIKEGDGGSRP